MRKKLAGFVLALSLLTTGITVGTVNPATADHEGTCWVEHVYQGFYEWWGPDEQGNWWVGYHYEHHWVCENHGWTSRQFFEKHVHWHCCY